MTNDSILRMQWNAAAEAHTTEQARRAPHVLMRPAIFPDGNTWCALYGEDLQSGVAGFGETPEAACADFDKNWSSQKLSMSTSAASHLAGCTAGTQEECTFRMCATKCPALSGERTSAPAPEGERR